MAENQKKPVSKNKRIRRMASNIIMVCLAAIMVVSGFRVYTIMKNYKADRAVYDRIAEAAGDVEKGIDFDALSKINPDVIGWLIYDDTVIDYPVVQGENNDVYLSMLFDRTWGGCGTLFADAVTEAPFRQFNTIIYGHHMRDGSMFNCLKLLKDPAWTADHPRLKLYTPDGDYYLEVWAFLNQPSDSDIYLTNMTSEEKKAEYITLVENLASYTTGVKVTTDDMLVLLSTCAYEYQNARYIVVCKMVPM